MNDYHFVYISVTKLQSTNQLTEAREKTLKNSFHIHVYEDGTVKGKKKKTRTG